MPAIFVEDLPSQTALSSAASPTERQAAPAVGSRPAGPAGAETSWFTALLIALGLLLLWAGLQFALNPRPLA